MFLRYVALLAVRLVVLAWGVFLWVRHPERLSTSERFGLGHGLSYPNVLFLLMMADMATKLFPQAHIAVGSLKQYRSFQVPTGETFRGGREALSARVRELLADGRERGRALYDRGRAALDETYEGLRDGAQQLLRDIDVLRVLPFDDEDLTADARMRALIRHDRLRETVPVLLFWVAFNVTAAFVLGWLGLLDERTLVLWATVYFVFDMVCVVLWCPLQLLLMRNRCCTTCQIFNWDAIMYTTPLLVLVAQGSPFALVLVGCALVVLVRWELAFFRHPERFDERTNASLRCVNCTDRLCYLRGSLRDLVGDLPEASRRASAR